MVKVAAIQLQMSQNQTQNINNAISKVTQAAKNGAKIILLPELFENLYFCKDMDKKYFSLAKELNNHPTIKIFSDLAKELKVVLPISYFEKSGNNYYNSLVVIDADGKVLDNYRKTHIPDGPGYEEKFYFKSGDTGFKVWDTKYAKLGVAICWDQWFSECARVMALKGAQILMYPTAIGSEPEIKYDSKDAWQRVQMGHSIANTIPLIASNRVGYEIGKSCNINFYGSSFCTDNMGKIIAEASKDKEEIIYASYNLDEYKNMKEYWGLFRDRQPHSYLKICETTPNH